MSLPQKRIIKLKYLNNFFFKKLNASKYLSNKDSFYKIFYQSRRFGRWIFSKNVFKSSYIFLTKSKKQYTVVKEITTLVPKNIPSFFIIYIYQLMYIYKLCIYLLLKIKNFFN